MRTVPPNPRGLALAVPALLTMALASCVEHDREGFDDVDPAARIRSIQDAAATGDRAAIPELIRSLDSDDPAERLLAIHTLQKLTGQTFGYDHSAPRPERMQAAQRWADWYSKGGGGASTGSP
jgi:hypothetical protein